MKILITTDWYYPAINGAVTSVLNLKKELIKEGNDIDVYLLHNTSFSERSVIEKDINQTNIRRSYYEYKY